ncbi:hypothetical protein [uncultured Microbacterium sp.]|uniref:hypothetical protein n=1 Tax=uncultured Microbacterium sp. TaxID=191216 RepID=UPI0025D57626|nr:hypothetical protein [uncultured Microbacterium sp.]
MAKKITLLLDAGQLRWALRGALAAAATDDVTPVLCAVNWVVEGKHVHLVATDRYRVHETLVPRPKGAGNGEFLMDRRQAAWILANAHRPARSFPEQQIRVSWTEGTPTKAGRIAVEVIASEADDAPVFRYEADAVRGKFPPVRRLFKDPVREETEVAAENVDIIGLDPKFIASMQHLVGYRGEPLVFTMPKPGEKKLSPMRVSNVGGTARALLQPNLLINGAAEWQGGELAEPAPVAKASAA